MILSTYWYNQPWFYVLMLLAIFGAIVIGVILAKKYLKPFQNNEKPKSDKEIVEEEVNRLVRPVEDKKIADAMNAASLKESEKSVPPTKAEARAEEIRRATKPVSNKDVAKQMDDYAKSHPEEVENAKKGVVDSNKKK